MNVNLKDDDFSLEAEGTTEFCSSVAQTVFYFKGVADWKQPNHLNEITKIPVIKDIPLELKEKLDQSPKNKKKHIVLTEKYCSKCDTTKPVTDFNKSKKDRTGYQSYCRKCSNKERGQYYKHKKQTEPVTKNAETELAEVDGKNNLETVKLIRWYEGRTVFDIRDFLNTHKDITRDTADTMLSRLVLKNKIIQLSNNTFKVV